MSVDLSVRLADGEHVVQFYDHDDDLVGVVGGSPDDHRFADVIGGLVQARTANGQQVRVYGEMVALLWGDGNVPGAIELERLWNGLGAEVPFSLFCAYQTHRMRLGSSAVTS